MNQEILSKVKQKKLELLPKGFVILGVFGSFARGEETENSDLDLLYELSPEFYNRYSGWEALSVVQEIRQEISSFFQRKVDIANKNALRGISKENILSGVVYV
jgi:uncharacterized protein